MAHIHADFRFRFCMTVFIHQKDLAKFEHNLQ